MTKAEYDKAYTKEKLHIIKVAVQKDEMPRIKNRADQTGMKVSTYIKSLMEADLQSAEVTTDGRGQNRKYRLTFRYQIWYSKNKGKPEKRPTLNNV